MKHTQSELQSVLVSDLSRRLSAIALFGICLCLPTQVRAQETSVNPGINSSFETPDVAQFVDRFERDGREVYDRREEVIQACKLRYGMIVADVGAGTGLFSRIFSDQVGPNGHVYAVDISDEFIAHIQKRCADEGLHNISPVLCGVDDVRLPPNSVDVVFICDTYHHFEFPQKTLASIRRALRPEGILILIDFHRIEGVSSEWTLNHVRAGQEVVQQEVLDAGFEVLDEAKDLLKENYFVRFRVAGK